MKSEKCNKYPAQGGYFTGSYRENGGGKVMNRVLIIGEACCSTADPPEFFQFCCVLAKQWDCKKIFMGDVIDHHVSFPDDNERTEAEK